MTGFEFEKVVEDILRREGHWVHRFAKAKDGSQPFDVLALKDGYVDAYDCKVLQDASGYFPFARVEDNQLLSFALLDELTWPRELGYLIWHGERIWYLPSWKAEGLMKSGAKGINTRFLDEWKYQS